MGSWVVISGVRSRVTIVITHIRGFRTLLITTHEPPSSRASYSMEIDIIVTVEQTCNVVYV